MREKIIGTALDRALRAPIPAATETYSPIAHSEFLSELRTKLSDNSYAVKGQRLFVNGSGTKLVGFYDVDDLRQETPEDFGFRMSIGFKNSYDKSMSAALVVGATVIICSNGMVSGDLITFRRKHTGNVLELLREKMQQAVLSMNSSFARLVADAEIMKSYELTPRQKAEILGVMYFEKEIVTPNQLSVVKKELITSENFRGNTVWDLYNNVTVALKKSHPLRYVEDHIRLHDFMSDIAGISHAPLSEEVQEIIAETADIVSEGDQALAATPETPVAEASATSEF